MSLSSYLNLGLVLGFTLLAGVGGAVTPNDEGVVGADDSASIQNAVRKAVKDGTGIVTIPAFNARTGKPGWTLGRSVLLPGQITIVIDNARLTLEDDVYANFFRGENVWTDKGRTPDGKLSQIRIFGRGNAVLDGGKANDLNESTSLRDGRPHVRANCPILLVNTEHFEVSGLTIENHRYWGLCFEFCRFGRIANVRFVARYDRRNQDGINLRDGCHDIVIENISGQTGDDMIALSAIDRPRDDKWSYYVDGLSPDIRNVFIRNVSGAAVCHPLIALRNHNGARLQDITIENVRDTVFAEPCARGGENMERYALVRLGNGNYWSDRKATLGEMARITLRGLTANHSAAGVVINNALQDALISDVRIGGTGMAAVTTRGPDWGIVGASLENVTIENVHVDSLGEGATIFDSEILNSGDRLHHVRLRNCSVIRAGARQVVEDETISRDGPPPAQVVASAGVAVTEGELTLDRSGRLVFEANFAEGLPGWKTRNYGNKLVLGVEELHGERAFSVTLPGKKCDTLFEAVSEEFPVTARRGFRVDIRARGTMQMEKAAGQKGCGGTAVEFLDADGKLLETRFCFGFKTEPDAWTDTTLHGVVPEGAVKAHLMLGADDPNFPDHGQLLISRATVALKTPDSVCVESGWMESVPFRSEANPYVVLRRTSPGKSSVRLDVSTAPDAGGCPGVWSAWQTTGHGKELPFAAGGWLKYRITLTADGHLAPRVQEVRFGTVRHSRWAFDGMIRPDVTVLTASPTQDRIQPIRFTIGGPVPVNPAQTSVWRLKNFTDSKEVTDIMAQVRRSGAIYEIMPEGGEWKQDEVVKFKVVAQDVLGNTCEETREVFFGAPTSAAAVTLRDDGFMLVGGKPFFPIGLFSIKKMPQNGECLATACDQLVEAGFNLAHTYMWKRDDPDWKVFLDETEKRGIRLLLNPARQELTIPEERNRSNVLAWYLADDTSRHWTVDQLRMRDGFCKALDGVHPTAQADSLGSGGRSRYADYIDCTDIFLPELYTVCSQEPIGNEVTFVGSQMKTIFRELKEAGSPVKSVWVLLQHFSGWGGWPRYPTRVEQRAMSYLAIIRGAHGLMWYTYGDSLKENPKNNGYGAAHTPETWADLAYVTRELASIQDDLAAPNVRRQPAVKIVSGPKTDIFGDPSVSALLKDNEGDRLLIAVNTAAQPVKAKIALHDVRKAVVLFEDARSLPTEEDGYGTHIFAFTDDFKPNEVHVYRLQGW